MLLTGNNQHRNIRRLRTQAFTLVELILVMVLMLVVMSIAAPSLSKFFKGRNLDSEARRIVALTRYGQSRAVSEGVPMTLWINPKQGTYGVTEEAGYNDIDSKELQFDLAQDVSMEFADMPLLLPTTSRSGAAGPNAASHRKAPMIRFTPDGYIGETSPFSIVLRETKGSEVLWITQTTNRLNYEIETNASPRVRR
ncbi:MAG: type secretion system protein [Verrucomicrobiales bacterium]|nr:type secretion system protein [Verrucomicrobiales bacterium]